MINVIKYLLSWSCPHKRRFFFELFTHDGPIVTFDFSLLFWWHYIQAFLLGVFDPHFGQLIQYGAGLSAIWLTVVRIRHFNKLMKDMNQKPPQND